ncbi:MAG: hypothetical protein HKN53_12860, partial [Maribacter sp.]|nr:hypothetical protein [Maribacter sp.]
MRITAEKLLTYCILSLTLSLSARSHAASSLIDIKSIVSNAPRIEVKNTNATRFATNPSSFVEAAKKNNIPQREFKNLEGLKNGYYIIAGVFGEIGNAKKATYRLRKKGFDTNYISVPESGLNYVYLVYHEKWEDAIRACNNQFNGKYLDKVWIMNAQSSALPINHQFKQEKNTTTLLSPLSAKLKNKGESSVKSKSFLKTAEANNISTRKLSNIIGQKNGYYIISGVYSEKGNAKRMVQNLRKKGFKSDYFSNPENNLIYTYLEYHENWVNAIKPITSKFNGTFKSKVWILNIENASIKDKTDKINSKSFLQA